MKAKLVTLAVTAMTVLTYPAVAQACVEGVHYWDGGNALNISSSNPTGISAIIYSDNPLVCQDSNQQYSGMSSAWVMLNNSNGNAYAQNGWTKDAFNGQTGPTAFSAWWHSGMTTEALSYYYSQQGQPQTYATYDNTRSSSNGGYINFSFDGTIFGQVYWNNVFGTYPCDGLEIYGEISGNDDQIPGTSLSPVYFNNVTYTSYHPSTNTYGAAVPDITHWDTGHSTSVLNNGAYSLQNGDFDIYDTMQGAQ